MNLKTVKDIGLLVRSRRRALRLDQQALADRIGVSRQWVIDLEKGKPRVATDLVLRALNALALDLVAAPRDAPKAAQYRSDSDQAMNPGFHDVDLDALIDRARGRKP